MNTRIALFNDTGRTPHVGCRAVSSGLDRLVQRLGLTVAYRSYFNDWRGLADKKFLKSDLPAQIKGFGAVVVNGEGTIHHKGGRHLIAILRGAQRMGLQTHLVNAVLQGCDDHREVLQRLTSCTVRDLASSSYLDRLGVSHRVVFDASLHGDFLKRPAIDLTGKIVVTDGHGSRPDVVAALYRTRKRLGSAGAFYPLNHADRADQWRHAVADLRQAQAVITGRHHGVCLAVMAGVPFVALGSNTWKVEGLLQWLPGAQSVCDPGADLVAACDRARNQPAVFRAMQQWTSAMRPLGTLDGLIARAA